jgi:hypothetical protein
VPSAFLILIRIVIMKIIKHISKVSLFIAILIPIAANRAYAQAEIINLLSVTDGPAAVLLVPISDLGVLPPSIDKGGAIFSAGFDILSNDAGPLGTVLGLGGPLKGQLVPILDVLIENPLSTVDYFLGGGTIISQGLTVIPAVPLLNSPLPGL